VFIVTIFHGWPDDLSDEAILERLLALNLGRAAGQRDPKGLRGQQSPQPAR
jgi:hypothetical protein